MWKVYWHNSRQSVAFRAMKFTFAAQRTMFAVVAVSTLALAASKATAQTNLLVNPGFELGTTAWSVYGSSSISASSVQPHTGVRCLLIQSRENTWDGASQSLLGLVQAGVPYRISAWVRLEAPGAQSFKLTVLQVAAGVTDYINVTSATVTSTNWMQLNGGFTLAATSNLTTLRLYVEGPAAGTNFYADDFVVSAYDWKAEANARIEQIRKREVRLLVLDARGLPVPGTSVSVRQTRHRFGFGSAINTKISNPSYAAFFRTNFEWAVMENEAKWYANEPSQGQVTYASADSITNFCFTNGISLRGHCLFWAVDSHVQSWVTNLANAALQTAISNRIGNAVRHFRGTFRHWDVNNEMLHGNFYGDRLGDWINSWMFQQAHAIAPEVTLFVNDYNVVSSSETDAYKQQIRQLIASNAPVGGIGAQGHFGDTVSPVLTDTRLDSLSELGLPIWITEYDSAHTNEVIRADNLETLYRIAFSKPAVEGVLMWGFWAGSHWRGSNAAIVNLDWSLNEAGRRYQSLLTEWTTRTNATTDSAGVLGFRGFHGSYDLLVTPPGGPTTLRRLTVEPGSSAQSATLTVNPGDARPFLHGQTYSATAGQFTFQLTGEAGRSYQIQSATAMFPTNPPVWTALTSVSNPSGTISVSTTNPSTPGRRFFRARQLP